jgi:glycosyltransferase involved in cell wall biosynthesis
MIEHHLAHGVDRLIVTDNGSVDGTREILESFGDDIDLRHDPVHRKQQFSVVTAMAREAYARYHADWVINADADEFWLPRRDGRTLHDVFDELDPQLRTFTVPVIDMTGAPAAAGTGLQRLTLRDTRPVSRLQELGLRAHSTPDAVHVGHPDIEVAQGNHFVNLTPGGEVPEDLELEVLHFPWRSWRQFSSKVEKAGRAYESNPDLLPSPNHHGMREYRRFKRDALFAYYVIRHPDADETARGLADGTLIPDDRISSTQPSPEPDAELDPNDVAAARRYGPILVADERDEADNERRFREREAELLGYIDEAKHTIDGLLDDVKERDARLLEQSGRLEETQRRFVVRATDWAAHRIRR